VSSVDAEEREMAGALTHSDLYRSEAVFKKRGGGFGDLGFSGTRAVLVHDKRRMEAVIRISQGQELRRGPPRELQGRSKGNSHAQT
jgi:hypothetical protein